MKYLVFYIKNSEPKVKSFETLGRARVFADKFKTNLDTGDWIDYIIKGEFIEVYDGLPVLKNLTKSK